MPDTTKFSCAFCNSVLPEAIIDLGIFPPLNKITYTSSLSLKITICNDCGLTQLKENFHQLENFPPEYPFRTSGTNALVKNLDELKMEILDLIPNPKNILEIGCNDFTFLKMFQDLDCNLYGIDPVKIISPQPRINYVNGFFPEDFNLNINFDLVAVINTFAHLNQPKASLKLIHKILSEDGVLALEVVDLDEMLRLNEFDKFTHEHRIYLSEETLSNFLKSEGFEILHMKRILTHGGSLRVIARKTDSVQIDNLANPSIQIRKLSELNKRITEIEKQVKLFFESSKINYKKCVGIGATNRGAIFLSRIGINLEFVVDRDASPRVGRIFHRSFVIGDTEFLESDTSESIAIILAWHVAREIVDSLKSRGYKGKFLVLLPRIMFLT